MWLFDYCHFCKDKHIVLKTYCIKCKNCTLNSYNSKCLNCKYKKINILSNCENINTLININHNKYKGLQKSKNIHLIKLNNIYVTYTDYQKKLDQEYDIIKNYINLCNKRKCHDIKQYLIYNKENNKNNTNLINKQILNFHLNRLYDIIKNHI
jgi:hypothetical protein